MLKPQSEVEQLRSLLGTTLGNIQTVVSIEPGTTGTSYRIETDDSQYVAKFFSTESDVLLGPRAQFDLLQQLAPSGIAPLPAAYDESAGVLVTEYIDDADAVGSDELRQLERICEVAALLQTLHRAPADVPSFAPEKHARRYISRLGGHARLSRLDRKRGDELLKLATRFDCHAVCLCHNDLTADNLLFGRSPKLIDFDYAVVGPPILDLASVVVMNSFSPAEGAQLQNAYFDGRESPFSGSEFASVQRLVRLLAHFWSLASKDAAAAIVAKYRIEDV